MPLTDELFDFRGMNGGPSRCRVRLFSAPGTSSGYVFILTDDASAFGCSITNAAEHVAGELCRRFRVPPERAVWVEHYSYAHWQAGHDGSGQVDAFARIVFASATSEALAGNLSPTLGRPTWTHLDRAGVEKLIGQPLP